MVVSGVVSEEVLVWVVAAVASEEAEVLAVVVTVASDEVDLEQAAVSAVTADLYEV